ncbi:MAG TPA: pyridoxal phosphate-dependent aminotransferase [Gemmatimonadaceae bacterium]
MTVRRAFVPSPNIAQLKESATIAVSARAKALRAAGRRIIDLGAGEPDFDTPEFIRRAAQQAIDAGATHYTATEGILPLREAIAALANADYRGDDRVTPGDIVVSAGSKQSLFNACFVLFGAGDEVLIPTPSWTSYYEMVALARAEPVPVYGDPANGLKVSAESLAAAASPATKGVMLNSPCNPTGAMYDRAELEAILALADERGWWVISDEIYRRIAYGGVATSTFEVAGSRDRLILVDGVAKAYAMTGWRIGWAIAPRAVSHAMGALQSHTTSNAAAVSQHAALAALSDRAAADASIAHMVGEFERRRDAALAMLAGEPGIGVIPPDGAFYLFLDVSATRGDSRAGAGGAFAQHLLERHDVAVVPGAAFYTPDWVRLSYAAPLDQVVTGVQRAVAAFHEMIS